MLKELEIKKLSPAEKFLLCLIAILTIAIAILTIAILAFSLLIIFTT